ncbi:hypothetical protein Nepgr_005947 [Nepenthes gracilis]|uniref:Growth-regulating factor n=1 Tax=Nepenthes gracilis TaxID=150966 RepID=A0AAD3XGY0_NEPGR|nr:hypothetical protein Nepgr_005947 [Nepenthes gracilis]
MSGRSKFPFTSSQWQELEHQALIYKYMAAGMSIPPDLLFTVKRSLDSSLSSKFFPFQTSPIGWNPYQMGYGKKLDPEPGRCRRTDGKKWRCSKEAYPDSKYCERHMHRGKNRSRKPVEVSTTAAAAAAAAILDNHHPSSTISSITKTTPSTANPTLHSLSPFPPPLSATTSYDTHHLLYPHSSSSRPPGITLSAQDSGAPLLLESGSFRERYLPGMKGEVGEHAFFSETSGTMRGLSGSSMDEAWQLNHFKLGGGTSLNQPKNNICPDLQSGYPYLELKSETSKQEKQSQQCYVWGRDFNCDLSMKLERENEPQKTIHHFFDEWPPKGRDSWHDSSTTQLSISTPIPSHDFFRSNSTTHNDG